MSWLETKLPVAINERLINKNDRDDKLAFSEGWEDFETTIEELAGAISKGFAFCAQMKGGKRKATNFVQCGFLAVDVDDGLPLDQIENVDIVKSSGTMTYTTASHTDDAHRYRIVFALQEAITDRDEYSAALRSLALRVNGDKAATDPARIFYGNANAEVSFADRGLSNEQVRELVDQSFRAQNSGNQSKEKTTTRSLLKLKNDQTVITASGIETPLTELGRSTSIYCPKHHDTNPSAFVVISQHGTRGVHCSTCDATFWSEDLPVHNFYAFDEQAIGLAEQLQNDTEEDWDPSTLPPYFKVKPGRINIVDECYVESASVEPGVTFIKSPKGSGKTEFLKRLVSGGKSSVLLIGHRRTLIGQMCARLGLNSYLDKNESGKNIDKRRYGVSLDSIQSIPLEKDYDFVLIDESEQVLAHILSDTLSNKRTRVFQRLQHIIKKAKHVVALDADLGPVSFSYISHWARAASTDKPIALYLNQHKPTGNSLTVYHDQNTLIGEIEYALKIDSRIYVTSNSKSLIDKIFMKIQKDYPNKKFLVVTSETTAKEPVKKFLEDASGQSIEYDAIFASPSISSGIDITFSDESQHFDVVYGLFESGITNHFECDQQLSRVRQPKAVSVYLSPRPQFDDTNRDTIMSDVVQSNLMEHLLTGYDQFLHPIFNDQDELLQFVTTITAQNRESINNLKENFIEHKSKQGWTIIHADFDNDLAELGQKILFHGKAISDQQYAQSLLNAQTLNDTDFTALDKRQRSGRALTEDQFCSLQRTRIERFYCREITEDLIALDKRGKYRSAVSAYGLLINNQFADLWKSGESSSNDSDLGYSSDSYKNRYSQDRFIRDSLELLSLLHDRTIDTSKVLTADDMGEFVQFLSDNAGRYSIVFGKPLHADYKSKPFSQLGVILSNIGLKLQSKKTTRNGRNIYLYNIDQYTLNVISNII